MTVHPSGRFAYVTNASSSNVSAYSIDPATGALTAVSGSPFATGSLPFSLEVDPSDKFADVASRQSNSVSAFAIDPATGALTPVAGSPFAAGTNPVSLKVDPSSKFVFVANTGGGNVSAYTMGSNGALTPVAGSPFAAGSQPNSVRADPSGKFAYVANLDTASESISEYAIDPTTGTLTSLGEVRTRGQAVSVTISSGQCAAPVLYAIDVATMRLLWRSASGQPNVGGKHNHPTIARGVVFIGTDRIQAFGLSRRLPVDDSVSRLNR